MKKLCESLSDKNNIRKIRRSYGMWRYRGFLTLSQVIIFYSSDSPPLTARSHVAIYPECQYAYWMCLISIFPSLNNDMTFILIAVAFAKQVACIAAGAYAWYHLPSLLHNILLYWLLGSSALHWHSGRAPNIDTYIWTSTPSRRGERYTYLYVHWRKRSCFNVRQFVSI